jgi:uncharacterized protein (DUF433 family)
MKPSKWISVDPQVVHGTPVFAGTRVPARTLFEWLEEGYPLQEFLDNFPTVEREQAEGVLAEACEHLLDPLVV